MSDETDPEHDEAAAPPEDHPDPPRAAPPGVRIGDFVVTPAVAFATDDRHDDFRNDERLRGREEDARAAQQSGVAPPERPDLLHPKPRPVAPAGELDAAIEEARAEAAAARADPGAEIPILLRDPVTGEVIGRA